MFAFQFEHVRVVRILNPDKIFLTIPYFSGSDWTVLSNRWPKTGPRRSVRVSVKKHQTLTMFGFQSGYVRLFRILNWDEILSTIPCFPGSDTILTLLPLPQPEFLQRRTIDSSSSWDTDSQFLLCFGYGTAIDFYVLNPTTLTKNNLIIGLLSTGWWSHQTHGRTAHWTDQHRKPW